jgi:hypothetical protein
MISDSVSAVLEFAGTAATTHTAPSIDATNMRIFLMRSPSQPERGRRRDAPTN